MKRASSGWEGEGERERCVCWGKKTTVHGLSRHIFQVARLTTAAKRFYLSKLVFIFIFSFGINRRKCYDWESYWRASLTWASCCIMLCCFPFLLFSFLLSVLLTFLSLFFLSFFPSSFTWLPWLSHHPSRFLLAAAVNGHAVQELAVLNSWWDWTDSFGRDGRRQQCFDSGGFRSSFSDFIWIIFYIYLIWLF